ncbi:MAG: hypothetical protein QM774_07480 [Gordonia sp. (in: high G+C Gram-positive bacteria)]|uniref:FAD-dependent oxidoreductase n=1 Tax=Gordonia sp. (in: high G+C Gram-positive bacteria) TaxID=84139 RepID=UPI0039E50577
MTSNRPPTRSGRSSSLSKCDQVLDRVSMYRLVTLLLCVLAAIAFLFSALGVLDRSVFPLGGMALALIVLLSASVAASRLFGLLFRVRPHTESAVITALLMWFLYWPTTSASMLVWLAGAAVAANASKYLLAWRGRHVFNPAAVGPVLVVIIQELARIDPADRLYTTWWVASEPLLPFVLVAALLVLRRTHRIALGVVFVVVAAAALIGSLIAQGTGAGEAIRQTAYSYPLVFLAGFMLSEPLTLPPRRWQQLSAAALAGIVVALPVLWPALTGHPFGFWAFTSTTELALLAANLVGFACGQRRGIRLQLRDKQEIAASTWEFTFEPVRPVRFAPGQYLELHVPHAGADRRGTRRVFSISSHPDDPELTIALRVPQQPSSFKQALMELHPGDQVRATTVSGDFVLPDDAPLLLVAGGIGITPFVSALSAPADGRRPADAVLAYGVPDGDDIAYRDRLVAAGLPVVVVSPTAPADLPAHWSHVAGTQIDADALAAAVPDLDTRRAYISGPPAMVHTVRAALRPHVTGTRSDYFSGY